MVALRFLGSVEVVRVAKETYTTKKAAVKFLIIIHHSENIYLPSQMQAKELKQFGVRFVEKN